VTNRAMICVACLFLSQFAIAVSSQMTAPRPVGTVLRLRTFREGFATADAEAWRHGRRQRYHNTILFRQIMHFRTSP
jgi:hypothetical protein